MQAIAGQVFQWSLSFGRPKTGWVGVFPPGTSAIFSVNQDWSAYMRGAIDEAPFTNATGATVTLRAPDQPGTYFVQNIVPKDGGTVGFDTLTVTAPPTAAPPAAAVPAPPPAIAPSPAPGPVLNPWNPGGPVYTAPSPEPAASDGAKLSMQGSDVQAYYVASYGPGMLAATQFVIDHEHQLAAIGAAASPAKTSTTYTPPPTEPAASDGEKLSMESPDVQAYYVNKYGPGFLAAVGFVQERNASLGTSIPGGSSVVLPANGGAGVGVGGASGTDFSSIGTQTPGIPTAAGNPPPTVGGIVRQVEANKPLLIGLAVAGYFLLGGRMPQIGHRR